MWENDSTDEAARLAGAAIARLGDLGLATTPRNFTLFYAYESGRDPSLRHALEAEIASGRLSADRALALYDRFFGIDHGHAKLHEACLAMQSTFGQVFGNLKEAGGHTARFGQALNTVSGVLTPDMSAEALSDLVRQIATATSNMQQQNQALADQLTEASGEIDILRQDLEDVRRESLTDALTGIANRKYFDIRLMECMEQAQESTKPLSLLIMDIDHFKMFNDRHGHLLGDQVLRLVARTITESVKGRDTAARYGGEEFVVLLPETRLSNGMTVAQQIRRAVAGKKVVRKVTGQELGTVTLSVGVAELKAGELPEEFIRRADSAMYEAKGNGRNRVVAEDSGLMVHAASG